MNPEPCSRTRVLVDIDGGKVRTKVQVAKRKETKTMNYRDFDPNNSCLPSEAYPYLALALGEPKRSRPSLWGQIASVLRRYSIFPMTVFLPLADPPAHHLTRPVDHNSLVWVQPKEGVDHPVLLPLIVEANPYSL